MTAAAQSYTPIALQARIRQQAIRVWIVTTAALAFWLVLIVLAPLLDSSSVYAFFSYICHQMPERSLYLGDRPMAVCSRCFGIYTGLLLGTVVYPLWRSLDETEPVSRLWLFASIVPIGIDWSLTAFGIWENTHVSRLLTGIILGAACAIFIVPAIVDIVRNITTGNWRAK